tara:strand:- start:4110 stop:5138 length:1029 start_codon:yes stop_codon:yes gene_type:complete
MVDNIKVAILGSTGYVGIELVKILSLHPNVVINFLGSENTYNKEISSFDNNLKKFEHPLIKSNQDFNPSISDVVFLALPHGISNKYVKNYINKIKIIDLSADFRLSNLETYNDSYQNKHSCPEFLKEFIYGLSEIYRNQLINAPNIAIPGCYPTSILLPLIPLLKNNIVESKNIIIDSKSGYSGAGKNFDKKNIGNDLDFNFYNYNTNNHRHISEIKQELTNFAKDEVTFTFNPHILPNFRGMMSTIYCDLKPGISFENTKKLLQSYSEENIFIDLLNDDSRSDFFSVQRTNKCVLKLFKGHQKDKIIIISLIDNLVKGAAGQATQCFNLSFNLEESTALKL